MAEQIRNDSVAIGTAQVRVAPFLKEGQRTALTLVNASAGGQTISLSWGQEAALNTGIVLYPSGSWSESIDSAFIPSNLNISAISSAAGGVLAIQERVRV